MELLVLTPNETAKMIRVSPNVVYEMLENGELPGYRSGNNWKIPKSALIKHLDNKAEEESRIRREVNVRVYEEE